MFQRRRDAQAVIEAVIQLPAEQNLALMCQVHAQDIRRLPDYLADLVSFAGHFVGERGLRFGVEGLVYWVRHWVRADGSFREFGARFGVDHKTAAKFYREVFEPVLDGWLTAAVGTMEPVALAAWPAEEELAA